MTIKNNYYDNLVLLNRLSATPGAATCNVMVITIQS
jgi:hypothetical protein